jgi:hypothetical protein
MTDFSSGGMHQLLCSIAEGTYGTSPATFAELRHTSCSLQLSKDTFQSKELRGDRQITDFRHGTQKVDGDIAFELSWAEYDTLLQAGFCGTWQTVASKSATTVGCRTTTKQVFSSSLTFGYLGTGDCIYVSGFTGGGLTTNGVHIVTAKTGTHTLTLGYSTLGSSSSYTATVNVKRLSSLVNGVTERSFTFERGYVDISVYESYTGCYVNKISLSLKPNNIVTGILSLMGRASSASVGSLDSTPTASQTGSPYDTFAGAVKENGSTIALITGIDFNLENSGENVYVIGSQYNQAIVLGRCNVTGSLELFFQDTTMINKFTNETETLLEFNIGATDRYYKVFIPRIKYGSADHAVDGEGPITLKMNFQALYSSTYGFTAQITRVDI